MARTLVIIVALLLGGCAPITMQGPTAEQAALLEQFPQCHSIAYSDAGVFFAPAALDLCVRNATMYN